MRVPAVVVTYNRKDLLVECVEGLARQTHPVQRVIVIDNASTDGTREALEASGVGDRVRLDYVRLERNGGGSEGFHYGVREALREESEWIWVMDDDCEPRPDALEKLLASDAAAHPATSAIGPKVTDGDGQLLPMHRGRIVKRMPRLPLVGATDEDYAAPETELGFLSFVGPMFRTDVVRRMGAPPRHWFIRFEDLEYSARAAEHGRIWLVNDAVVLHKEPVPMHKLDAKAMWRNFTDGIPLRELWRTLYGMRNMMAGGKAHGYVTPLTALSYFALQVVRAALFDEHRLRVVYLTAMYFSDGWRGRFRNVPPGRWAQLEHESDIKGFIRRESLRYDRDVAAAPERLVGDAASRAPAA
jgi:rhamnopyranosyl-N-acetylglucosaminyl-diphospho-decaprenol beta-1,3/1,4-galactofuranosyltransferase